MVTPADELWHGWLAFIVRVAVAPLVLFCSGFFTMDFLLSGVYTWPRTSRVLVLTLTIVVLGYEFIFKEQREQERTGADRAAWRAVVYSCFLPYAVGVCALVALATVAL